MALGGQECAAEFATAQSRAAPDNSAVFMVCPLVSNDNCDWRTRVAELHRVASEPCSLNFVAFTVQIPPRVAARTQVVR